MRSQLLSSKPRQHAVGPSARTRCFKSQPLSQEWGCLCPHPRRDRGADPFQGSSAPPCPPRWGSHRNPLSGVGLCDQEGVPAQAPRIAPKRPPARAGRPRKAPAHIRSKKSYGRLQPPPAKLYERVVDKNPLRTVLRCHLFGLFLGLSWAILGPTCGHPEPT